MENRSTKHFLYQRVVFEEKGILSYYSSNSLIKTPLKKWPYKRGGHS